MRIFGECTKRYVIAIVCLCSMIYMCSKNPTSSIDPFVGAWTSKFPVLRTDQDEVVAFTFHTGGKLTGIVTDHDWDIATNYFGWH